MADFHAADLWVAVVPETSQVGPAMEQAGKEAKGKFGDAVKGFGKEIHDGFDKIGEKAKHAGKNAGTVFNSELGRAIREPLGAELGKAITDKVSEPITKGLRSIAGEQWGQVIGDEISKGIGDTVGGWISGAKQKVKGVKEATDDLKQSFADIRKGELSGVSKALDTIDKKAKDVGVDLGGWTDPLQKVAGGPLNEVQNKTKDIRNQAHDFLDVFKDLPGKIGASATALGALVDGPLAAAVAAAMTIDHALHIDSNTFDPGQHGWGHVLFGKTWDWLGGGDPNTGLDKHGLGDKPAGPTPPPNPADGGSFLPSLLGGLPKGAPLPGSPIAPTDVGGAPPSSARNFYKDWYPQTSVQPPAPAPSAPAAPSSFTDGGGSGGGSSSIPKLPTPSISSRADLHAAGGRVANLLAFARSLEGTPYSQALRNDCSGMVAKIANVAIGLDPAASFSTVNEGSWLMSHGFEPGLGGPGDLNIGWYDHGGGNAGHTAATLPGGIHAESGGSHGNFLLGSGAAGAENSEFTQHAHLRMDGTAGGSFRAASVANPGGGQIPTGAEHDPLYVTQASSGSGGSAGSSPLQSQGQQLGQGLLGGLMQSVGLDGSVFGGKSPMDFGAVKLGSGLLNYGMGLMNNMSPGRGGGGGLGGLAGLIPGPGAAISASAGPGGGSFGIGQQVGGGGGPTTVHNDNSVSVTTSHPDPYAWLQAAQFQQNGYKAPGSSNRFNLSPVPVGP